MSRLLKNLYEGNLLLDDKGRIRIDDLEMRDDVQEEVSRAWNMVNSDNIKDISDLEGYRNEFFQLFGFSINGVDYEKDIEIEIGIPSIES